MQLSLRTKRGLVVRIQCHHTVEPSSGITFPLHTVSPILEFRCGCSLLLLEAAPQHDSMQICTSMDVTSPSMAQHDLLGILPTLGGEFNNLMLMCKVAETI